MSTKVPALRLLCTALLAAGVATSCSRYPTPRNKAGREELRQMAQTVRPFIAAVEAYQKEHHHPPETAGQIGLPQSPKFGEWQYFPYSRHSSSANSYQFFRQTAWDPSTGLWFEHSPESGGRWFFDPGDGTANVDLTAEFSR